MTSKIKCALLSGCVAIMPLATAAFAATDHVPAFDVRSSCKAAETYDVMEDRDKTFKGCMQDEDRAHGLIKRNWAQFKVKDRVDCVTQAERVAPSYVEILTCLEMSDETGALLSKDVNQPMGTPSPEPANQPNLPQIVPPAK